MKADKLFEIRSSWTDARNDSGYAKASYWAMQNGMKLLDEITRLRHIIRVNGIRSGASRADIDTLLDGD